MMNPIRSHRHTLFTPHIPLLGGMIKLAVSGRERRRAPALPPELESDISAQPSHLDTTRYRNPITVTLALPNWPNAHTKKPPISRPMALGATTVARVGVSTTYLLTGDSGSNR